MNQDCSRMGRVLCEALPALFGPQVEAEGWSRAATILERMGLLTRRVFPVRPVIPNDRPLLDHRPGDRLDVRDAAEIARFTATRIRATRPIPLEVFTATPKAHRIWGDRTGKKGNPMALAHNYLLGAIWCRLAPGARGQWRYEVSGGAKFEKVPDAALVNDRGEPMLYHEAIGCYSASRILGLAEIGKPILMW